MLAIDKVDGAFLIEDIAGRDILRKHADILLTGGNDVVAAANDRSPTRS